MPSTYVESTLADLAPSALVHPPGHALVLREKGTSNFVRVREGVKAVGDVVRDAPEGMEFEVGFVPIPMKANGEPRRKNLGTPEQMLAGWVPFSDAVAQKARDDEVAAREWARTEVLRRIELRTLREDAEVPGDARQIGFVFFVSMVSMQAVVMVAHVEFSWLLTLVMVGMPFLACWYLSSSARAAEMRAVRRKAQIADEEWALAGGEAGGQNAPANLASRRVAV